jgi:ribosome biogenesis GTPase A
MPSSKPDLSSPSLVPRRLPQERDRLLELVRRGVDLARALGNPSLSAEIQQLSVSALKPFLFVVVGEVKSGKSSLINALLEAPICAVDSAPCTTRLQEIRFGEEEQRVEVSEFEERMDLPHEILRYIAIVDTPGTNSVIREHQVITENYIPQSDLILFVFFAKNPYTGSAWEFLHDIKHEWQRNTLFVLQQTDLLEPQELERTLALVKQQLVASGIGEPVVFPVSVQTGEGLDVLREYLRIEVVEGRQFNKNLSLTHNLLRFLRRFEGALRDHECLLEHDEALLGELRQLAVGLGPEADQEHAVLAARVRHLGDEAERWLARQADLPEEPASRDEARSVPTQGQGQSPPRHRGDPRLVAARALRDAASTGWETPLRTLEYLNRLQIELNRCLFRAHLRRLDLHRHLRRRLGQQLEAATGTPPCLSEPLQDALTYRREETLTRARRALDALDELEPDGTVPRAPVLTALGRWSSFYGVAQVGAALTLLALGYYLDGLSTGLLLALTGYLGAGYGLAIHSRARVGRYARAALGRSLADVDRRLRETLLTQPAGLQAVTHDTLKRFEDSVTQRRTQAERLLASLNGLREAIKRFQSGAWVEAVAGQE